MVKGLLFKWEDSPALNHHCGFCEKPMSHPGARVSCYGTHAEPCHRYHQIMFMRLRGHTCHYCRTIDEAHHNRHRKIAETLRDAYEASGEPEWSIVPADSEDRGRGSGYHTCSTTTRDSQGEATLEAAPSKRDRKDAKSLARAASRARVISQDEIDYIGATIHPAEGPSSDDVDGPQTTEEMVEIEKHLKYNAHVYSSLQDHRQLKKFARIPDVDVDFAAEVERILEALRVTRLCKRNTRNRGLQGKEFRMFQSHVDDLKRMIVDDLVSVKKDALEIRMRRAGYLRYTNKTAHNILEERYTDREWRTGEKVSSSGSDSSGLVSPADENGSQHSMHHVSLEVEAQSSTAPLKQGPDRRHLERIHMRAHGEDGLEHTVIDPSYTPLPALVANKTTRMPAVQIKVITDGSMSSRASTQDTRFQNDADSWRTVMSSKKSKAPTVKPSWGMTSSGLSVVATPKPKNPWGVGVCEIPDLRSLRASEVQPPEVGETSTANEPERFIDDAEPIKHEPSAVDAVVPQKKAKKQEREARRKAKRAMAQDAPVTVVSKEAGTSKFLVVSDDDFAAQGSTPEAVDPQHDPALLSGQGKPHTPSKTIAKTIVKDPAFPLKFKPSFQSTTPSPVSIITTQNNKHGHWVRYDRQFTVDQLSPPFLTSRPKCSHDTTCPFESNQVPDCPYHQPHCLCVDPYLDECYLVYPCANILSSGPYNRVRGEKLLAQYEQENRFKGRIMLVDSDLVEYFMIEPRERGRDRDAARVPRRLATEYSEFADGYSPGPLMEQEKKFECLWAKNKVIKCQLSGDMLSEAQLQKFEKKDSPFFCYCYANIPESGLPKDLIECAHRTCTIRYFHKSCIKKLGVEKVSRWYCTLCEQEMRMIAHKTLRDLGFDGVPDEDWNSKYEIQAIRDEYNSPDHFITQGHARAKPTSGRSITASVMIAMAKKAE